MHQREQGSGEGRCLLRLQRGTGAFTASGQLRVTSSGSDTVIQVNTDANLGTAEMEIAVKDGDVAPSQWVAGDFIL